ncbi:MAG: heme ABC transporter permease, partial [Caldimonas sp.]
ASVSFSKAPTMATPMLLGMAVMALAFWAYCIAIALARLRTTILERERHAAWTRQASGGFT